MKYKNVYVLCPVNWVTGGTEALHQLVDAINELGGNAYILYFNDNEDILGDQIPIKFRHYNIKRADKIIDLQENALVVPESKHSMLDHSKFCVRHIWWLGWFHFSGTVEDIDNDVIHMNQNEYVQSIIQGKGIDTVFPLSDYISNFQLRGVRTRKKTIAIAARKIDDDYEHLHNFILNKYDTVPIKNLSSIGLARVLQGTSCYIDLGIHSGKDRLPREAAINGNVVVTSVTGTCSNLSDVPIDARYKCRHDMEIEKFSQFIDDILNNHKSHSSHFDIYRKTIYDEKKIFFEEVSNLFFASTPKYLFAKNRFSYHLYMILELILVPFGLYSHQFNNRRLGNPLFDKMRTRSLRILHKVIP